MPDLSRAAIVLLCAACASFAHSADWPAKPIRMIHGFTPGGNVDITARIAAQILSEGLGQTVIVDGRPGAGGTLAANIVAKSEPDGYTLFTMASGHSISPGLYRSLPYDPVADVTMVSLVSSFPFVIAVGANSPVKSIAELIKLAKDKQSGTTLAHAGVGTGMHMSGVLLQARTATRFNEVPYKGGTAASGAAVPPLYGTSLKRVAVRACSSTPDMCMPVPTPACASVVPLCLSFASLISSAIDFTAEFAPTAMTNGKLETSDTMVKSATGS
jgi:tripartite-type tricarboxylate transporter receptor subunit TctC